MKKEIKIPEVGESISEVDIAEWKVSDGDIVEKDDILLVMDSDKASLELAAEHSGQVEIKVEEGETVDVGGVVGSIDTSKSKSDSDSKEESDKDKKSDKEESDKDKKSDKEDDDKDSKKDKEKEKDSSEGKEKEKSDDVDEPEKMSPSARKMAKEQGTQASDYGGSGRHGMVLKEDVKKGPSKKESKQEEIEKPEAKKEKSEGERETKKKMSSIRRKIASRLVMAQHTAAILTTFNEIDMSHVMELRNKYKEGFEKKHGIKLGFMSFFTRAAVEALKEFPNVNSYIDGDHQIFRNYYDISVAVSGPKGLMVPVVRDADALSFAEIEKTVKYYGIKAKEGKISIEDMEGGGFTISNGGVFGSMLSTPILNPPQTGILGLHKIEERPVVVNGEIVIRPMMYVALSYDHRVIDGKESVSFLVKVKEIMEDPSRILLEV